MLLWTGQCTWQKGTPHWEQRLDWAAASAGLYSLKISRKSLRRVSASRFRGMARPSFTNCSIFPDITFPAIHSQSICYRPPAGGHFSDSLQDCGSGSDEKHQIKAVMLPRYFRGDKIAF